MLSKLVAVACRKKKKKGKKTEQNIYSLCLQIDRSQCLCCLELFESSLCCLCALQARCTQNVSCKARQGWRKLLVSGKVKLSRSLC